MCGDVVQQVFHVHKNTGVIGGGSKDQVAIPEGGGHHIGRRGHGHVEHAGLDPHFPQAAGENLSGVCRIAIDRGVGNDHTGLLRGIGGPMQVLLNDLPNVLPPHEAVEGTDHLDLQTRGLGQQRSHLGAVFAHDVAVVPPGFIQVIPEEIHLIGK